MGASFLISLREGFEAALVISIVLAFVRRRSMPHLARWVWAGAAAAIMISVGVGAALHVTIDGLEGVGRARTFALISMSATALLTWMIFWMRRHGRELRAHLEERTASALADASGVGLALVAFAAVVREGLETALFLMSATSMNSPFDVVAGTLAGLAVACVLGVALFYGSRRINMRLFFDVTAGLIIVFAAGLVAKTVFFIQATGDIGTLNNAIYDLTMIRWLTVDTQLGRFLAGIFGWDPRPSLEQVAAYVLYLVPVGWMYFRKPRSAATAAGVSVKGSSDADARSADGEVVGSMYSSPSQRLPTL